MYTIWVSSEDCRCAESVNGTGEELAGKTDKQEKNGKQLGERRMVSFVSPLPPSRNSSVKNYTLKRRSC